MPQKFPILISVSPEDSGQRLDQFLSARLTEISRSRVQALIAQGKILVNDAASKPAFRLRGGECIAISGPTQSPPLRAIAEDIPLDIVYEDDELAVINKPAGMMVHAGAGATEDQRNRGTLVNALLYRFGTLSAVSGELRPGIVHRLDRATSGLILVAKNDEAHRKLATQFARRQVKKTYIALVHGWFKQNHGSIESRISRDRLRRIRMTTRRQAGREAVTHYFVNSRLESKFGRFSLLELRIETGRTHQIRVHLASLGHPIVGDTLYGAPRKLRNSQGSTISLTRNFLHAASLELRHPRTGSPLSFSTPLPAELDRFLQTNLGAEN
jgi:23S rRNA pseudouridine1911/1915/1917 synthase